MLSEMPQMPSFEGRSWIVSPHGASRRRPLTARTNRRAAHGSILRLATGLLGATQLSSHGHTSPVGGEQRPRHGDLGHLEGDIAAVADDLRADLDQLLLQARQRPVLDRLGRRQRAQEVAEIVGERMKLEPHGVGGERPARQPRPLDRALAFLDPLLAVPRLL